MANFMDWCVQAEKTFNGRYVRVGTYQVLDPGLAPREIHVVGPDDNRVDVSQRSAGPSIRVYMPGFYQVRHGKESYFLAANYDDWHTALSVSRRGPAPTDPGGAALALARQLNAGKGKPDKPLQASLLIAALALCSALWIGHGAGLLH